MTKDNSRVLSRLGARELAVSEMEMVAGSLQFNTLVCTIALATTTHTGIGDGDGCGDIDHT